MPEDDSEARDEEFGIHSHPKFSPLFDEDLRVPMKKLTLQPRQARSQHET